MPQAPAIVRRFDRRRRRSIATAMWLVGLMLGGCSAANDETELDLPGVLAPAAPWRLAEARMDERRLDAAAARYAEVFRERYGKGRYREFALARKLTWDELRAEFDAALPNARRDQTLAERQGDVQVAVWTGIGARGVLMLVYLADADPQRDDEPGFVLVYERTERNR